eukprot:CAMPEP_0204431990 /NCGR_PEP_ID=MMETSP0470-20130426/66304_1 /ASSEMBLY_ACC=CAM_ASM_000385 /TAXON_ID=2969 /ORGANISM="Oxyrrhis marina" /LENGTH=87 /DNA_ID=CAMNT_0051430247 /DNA_START=110 /DNA_END=373 /DNA_ORIENTATION=+
MGRRPRRHRRLGCITGGCGGQGAAFNPLRDPPPARQAPEEKTERETSSIHAPSPAVAMPDVQQMSPCVSILSSCNYCRKRAQTGGML